jgi:hypothetical protein
LAIPAHSSNTLPASSWNPRSSTTIADISTDVYWETDNQTPASQIGRHFFND